jgi:hypothetical protein
MNIISIDLSTKSTGVAFFSNGKLEKYKCLKASSTSVIKRIKKITADFADFLKDCGKIDVVILEEVRPDNKNLHTQKVLMWAQAAIAFCLDEYDSKIKIEYIYPSSWRSKIGIKTGRGIKRDTLKQADIQFVKDTFDIEVENDDVADAIGIGYSYVNKVPDHDWR